MLCGRYIQVYPTTKMNVSYLNDTYQPSEGRILVIVQLSSQDTCIDAIHPISWNTADV
jgi:hypothetical protein